MPDVTDPKNIQIVFFDGYCNLCNTSVDFIIRHNKTKNLYFSSLQGQLSKELGLDKDLDSFIFWNKGKIYKRSTASFELIPYVDHWITNILYLFKFLPRFITDIAYNLVAKYRYIVFGKKDTCRVASSSEKERFFD